MKINFNHAVRHILAIAFFVCVFLGGRSICKAEDVVYNPFSLNTDYQTATVTADPVYYSFTVPSDGLLTFSVNSFVGDVNFQVLSGDLVTTLKSSRIKGGSSNSPQPDSFSLALSAGNYCIKIYPYTQREANYGYFSMKATYTSYDSTENEPNDSFAAATVLTANTPITGTITDDNKSDDFYVFNVPYDCDLSFNFLPELTSISYTFYDANFVQFESGSAYQSSTSKTVAFVNTISKTDRLAAGTYYLKISHSTGCGRYTITYRNIPVTSIAMSTSVSLKINENFSLNPVVSPSDAVTTTLTYSSSDESVATVTSTGVINARKAGTVTITAIANDGSGVSASTKVVVVPSQVTGLAVKTAAPTKLTLTWNAIDGAKGYRVYLYNSSKKKYVKYKDVTKNTLTISKLTAEKKYKIKVEAYIKDGSKTVFGEASTVLSTFTSPKKLSATKITSSKITSSDGFGKNLAIKWKKVKGATGYIVYRKSNIGDWTVYSKTESTSAQIYLPKGYSYSIKVVPYRTKNGLTTNGKDSNIVKKKG